MALLGPREAALIADKVYTVRTNDIDTATELSGGLGLKDFELIENARFTGTSGPLFLKTETGFGYIASGVGKRQGELLIACRGTVPGIQDVVTDLNGGLQLGPSGNLVHAGFNDTFSSFKGTLEAYFKRKSPSHVHCVGHSLGGALATLVADYVSEEQKAGVSLYSFGCPRVGTRWFTSHLTDKVGAANIKRVYFNADVVPMVPIFPFEHVPQKSNGIYLEFPGGRMAPQSHFMSNYIDGVGDSDWLALERMHGDSDFSISRWLDSASEGGVMMFSAKLFWLIAKGIAYIVKKRFGVVLGTALVVTSTLLDKLAYLLSQGWKMGGEISGQIVGLFKKIFSYLGKPFSGDGNITANFARWVLDMLLKSTMNNAMLAMQGVATQLLPYETVVVNRATPRPAFTDNKLAGLVGSTIGIRSAGAGIPLKNGVGRGPYGI